MTNLSRDELIKALETAEKNPRDKLGLIGEFGVTAISGTGMGALASSLLAGTTTTSMAAPILGSAFLGKLLGATVSITVKAPAPVKYVVIAGVGAVALSWGLIKLIKSGVKSDKEIEDYIKSLKEKIKAYDDSVVSSTDKKTKVSKLAGIYAELLKINSSLTTESVEAMFAGIENGSIDVDFALNNAKSMLDELTK